MASKVEPSFSTLGPASFVINTRSAITPVKPSKPTAALPISAHSMPAMILATMVSRSMAVAICLIACPDAAIVAAFPVLTTRANAPTITIRPYIPTAALPMSSHDIVAISLATITKISIAVASCLMVFPAAAMEAASPPEATAWYAFMTATSAITAPASPKNPRLASSGSMEPMSFTTTASRRMAAAMVMRLGRRLLMVAAPFAMSTDVPLNLFTAIARAAKTPPRTAITPTACQSFAGSSPIAKAIIATAPAIMRIAIARFLIPSIEMLNAMAFSVLAKPITTLAIGLASSSRISAIPPKGAVKFWNADVSL